LCDRRERAGEREREKERERETGEKERQEQKEQVLSTLLFYFCEILSSFVLSFYPSSSASRL
jgi:hypothetical protein